MHIKNIIEKIFSLLAISTLAILTTTALLRTEIFPVNYIERPQNGPIYALIGSTFTLVVIATIFLIRHKQVNLSIDQLHKAQSFIIIFFGLTWLAIATTGAVADQGISLTIANQLRDGDIEIIKQNGYLQQYPFQSGYILFCSLISYLFGKYNMLLPIRFFNLGMAILSIKTLCKLSETIFKNEKTVKICIILSTAFTPFIFFSTFIYGNMPSISMCLISCYLQQKIISSPELSKKNLGYILGASIALFCAVWFKPNSLIFLVGIELIWAISFIGTKKTILIIGLVLMMFSYEAATHIPISIVEKQTGISSKEAIPKSAWIAMGLQESPERAPGWYNNYGPDLYDRTDHNASETNRLAKQEIKNRITTFVNKPIYAAKFFGKKISSTWAEPTFQSLWISYGGTGGIRDDLNHSKLEQSITIGKLHSVYITYCDVIQNLVYIGALYCIVKKRRELTIVHLSLIIIFLGGAAFHLFWETKSDYVLPYFFLLIPYAAAGYSTFIQNKKWIPRHKEM
ncbi:hypothetical protein JS532_10015 [Bifidobacterium callimiconis]|uniref:hypothetical protein n=1 Tax=Bifidobacterium callimiconis TaxID=2306973 RepID=UPI001BDC0587|nr:hypothetical protein [Bifidobacterium callimiconis]MBT1177886.1 hypothetical protein [Bifidobacterium callimiconis]